MLVAGCASEPEVSAIDALIGKELVSENGTVFLFNADGTMGGSLGGEDVVGEYRADATEVCSTYSAPEQLTGQQFCSVPEIEGNTVVFNRRDGSQSQTYTIGG